MSSVASPVAPRFDPAKVNRFLSALPAPDLALLASHLRAVPLDRGAMLHDAGDEIEHVYFPHSGMVSLVRLAAWMPATPAAARTSPLLTSRLAMADVVAGFMNTLQRATARRWVGSFGVTSTIRARPSGSRWVKERSLMSTSSVVGGLRPPDGVRYPFPRSMEGRATETAS